MKHVTLQKMSFYYVDLKLATSYATLRAEGSPGISPTPSTPTYTT